MIWIASFDPACLTIHSAQAMAYAAPILRLVRAATFGIKSLTQGGALIPYF